MAKSVSDTHTAIHAWASTGAGLSGNVVIWENQNVTRPAYPYGSLHVLTETPVGRPAAQYEYDGDSDEYTPVMYAAYAITVRVAYASQGATPSVHARAYAQAAQANLRLPSRIAALDAAQIGIARVGPITDISEHFNGAWITRVFFDVEFNVVYAFADTNDIGYIAHISGEGTVEKPDGNELTVPFESNAP